MSHRNQTHAPEHRPTTRNATVPQASRRPLPGVGTRNRSSIASSTSGERRSVDSSDDTSSKPATKRRLSGLPRATNTQSGPRLDAIAFSRPTPTLSSLNAPTVSRIAHSHPSEQDQDIFLFYPMDDTAAKSMAPTLLKPAERSHDRDDRTSLDSDPRSLLGQAFPDKPKPPRPVVFPPPRTTPWKPEDLPPRLIPELRALAAASAANTSAPSASISSISSPSTLFTESPGVWSSRNTTPTSMSSYSPAVIPPLKVTATGKRANTVPVPSVSKTKPPRLPVLQEALHSSGSSLTGKEVPPLDTESGSKRKKKKTPLNSPAPTPPPRTSSTHHRASKSGGDIPAAGQPLEPGRFVQAADPENSPLTRRAFRQIETVGESLQTSTQSSQDTRLLQPPPSRPSREGVRSLDPRRPIAIEGSLPSGRRDRTRTNKIAPEESVPEPAPRGRPPMRGPANTSGSGSQVPNRRPLPVAVLSRSESFGPQLPPKNAQSMPGSRSKQVPTTGDVSSSSRLGKFSRFAIFSRRTKQSGESDESPRKLQRKGPAAGTGHEGYGKFSRRGRKSPVESENSGSGSDRSESSLERFQNRFRSRKQSTSSRRDRSSQSDLDEFAAKRLQPVVILGGSARADSDGESSWPDLERELPGSSSSNIEAPWEMTDHYGRHVDNAPFNHPETNPQSSVLAPPRSEGLGFNFGGLRTTTPVERSLSVYPNSTNTSQSSVSAAVVSNSGMDPSMYRVDARLLKNQEKKGKRSKWNFFSRNTQSTKPAKALPAPPATAPKMSVRVSAGPNLRSVPYYAVMESDSENNTTETLGQVLADAVASPPPLPRTLPKVSLPPIGQQRGHSVLLPSLPLFQGTPEHQRQPSSPRVPLQRENEDRASPEVTTTGNRPRRLAAVGRIPRVVSRKGRQKVSEPPMPAYADGMYDTNVQDQVMVSAHSRGEKPMLGLRTDFLPHRQLDYSESGYQPNMYDAQEDQSKKEFLRFPSKHSSEVSASSGSTGAFSLIAPTSVLPPQPYAPSSRHNGGEDEVWNEYDDFIDHVMSPADSRSTAPASNVGGKSGRNFSAPRSLTRSKPLTLAKQVTVPEQHSSLAIRTPPVVFPPPLVLSESNSSGDNRLSRSRVVSALHSSIDSSSPFSVGDFVAEYGDWSRHSTKLLDRLSKSTAHKSGYLSSASGDQPVDIAEQNEHSQQHNAILLDVVGRSKNPAAQSELHFSSLMISRWLSFGRVLFSPAHDEIHSVPERHVLVLDGLGSVDWSVYCAVIYQEQRAFVHDLKEKDAGQSPIDPGHAPSNYRRAEVASLEDRFPFPPTFFSAIVLRFPPTMSDHKLRNILAECKRVLCPGGYLELMLLDLDIVNMGTQTRRAVKDLKIRITTSDRTINLKPLSDNVQSHLGQQGFLNLSRCVVGVPVAGKVSGSVGSSSSSHDSRGSYSQQRRSFIEGERSRTRAGQQNIQRLQGPNFSLNDLVSDHSDNADEKIGRMVSRTARSWWQHCFEAAVISDGNLSRSIFADKRIIRECKMRGSNFKLLIAYTQKPSLENKRRTISEPNVPTLATAGISRPKRNAL